MTDATIIPAPMQRKHQWPEKGKEKRISVCDSFDGNERTERPCLACGTVKITVHPPHGDAWREWRLPDGTRCLIDHTPPCRPADNVVSVASSVNQEQHEPEMQT